MSICGGLHFNDSTGCSSDLLTTFSVLQTMPVEIDRLKISWYSLTMFCLLILYKPLKHAVIAVAPTPNIDPLTPSGNWPEYVLSQCEQYVLWSWCSVTSGFITGNSNFWCRRNISLNFVFLPQLQCDLPWQEIICQPPLVVITLFHVFYVLAVRRVSYLFSYEVHYGVHWICFLNPSP